MGRSTALAMPLIGLLLALVLTGVLMGRLFGGTPVAEPSKPASPTAAPVHQAQRAVDAASKADRERLDNAMKALDSEAKP